MIIEKLKVEDIQSLLDLYKELVTFKNSLEESVEIYKEMLNNDKYILLAAKNENELIGSALGICCKSLATSGKPFLVIEDVIVKGGLRGMGIGKKLFEALDEFAKENNCAYSILVSSDFRKEAHAFYENLGFVDGVKGFRKMYE
ncbi:MAG: GNAT family N-acetyltransferase [Bacillota bacterium]|nr:GNAT family N-acetyltransferase [Bacillota bacterium]